MNKTIAGFLERNLEPLGIEYTYRDVFHERIFIQEENGWYTFYNYSIETSKGNFFIAHDENSKFSLFQDGAQISTGNCILDCLVKIRSLVTK